MRMTKSALAETTLPCAQCGQPFHPSRDQVYTYRKTGRVYCSKECLRKLFSTTVSRTNRKHASARMRANNPMSRPDSLEKMRTKLKELSKDGFLGQRLGNGTLTEPQKMLAGALRWDVEVAIPTGHWRDGSGYPTVYKVDIGDSKLKIAIEVDGKSHNLRDRKAEDLKKTRFLESLGWTVLRFSNAEVMANLSGCVQTVMSTISKSRTSTPKQLTA